MKTDLSQQNRMHLVDAVRGVCILGMVVYHALVDVILIFGITLPQGVMFAVNIVRDFGASCFIFLSGFCFFLGKHRLKRFIILMVAGAGVTAVTYFVMPQSYVIFGILTFMAISGGIAAIISPLLKHIKPVVGAVCSFLFFMVFFNCFYGYVGYYNFVIAQFPLVLYKNYFTAFLGFPFNGFTSGDYYPLLPWMFMYLFGYFVSGILQRHPVNKLAICRRVPFLGTCGRYSLYIYLAHQPIIYAAVYVAEKLIK